MKNIKEMYDKNINIMKYIRDMSNYKSNNTEAILMSYDLQAGSYIQYIKDNKELDSHLDGKKIVMNIRSFYEEFANYLANEFNKLKYYSVLEAGVGEASIFSYLIPKLKNRSKEINVAGTDIKCHGFDISSSRIMQGIKFLKENSIEDNNLFVADMFDIPFGDNTVDIVYTVHAIEPNTTSAAEIIKELYRVANKYIILIEPSYELGNKETKTNIDKHKYIKNLEGIVKDLNYKIIKYSLIPIGYYKNQSAIMIIEKNPEIDSGIDIDYVCPSCKSKLVFHRDNYFCKECFLVYPIIGGIPILKYNNGILYTQYLDS